MGRKDSVARRILQRPIAIALHHPPGVCPLPTRLRLQLPGVHPPASGMVLPGLLAHAHLPVALCSLGCSRLSEAGPESDTTAWQDVPYWQAQPMEPVCPDDGGVRADRRYSYAHKGTHRIRRHANVTGSYVLHWPPIQAVCDCRHGTSAARILRKFRRPGAGAPTRRRAWRSPLRRHVTCPHVPCAGARAGLGDWSLAYAGTFAAHGRVLVRVIGRAPTPARVLRRGARRSG